MRITLSSPAKLNLLLAITGRRPDGFHDLVSVAVPLAFGDELELMHGDASADPAGAPFTLTCDDPIVPTDATNLVLKAAAAFAAATGWPGRVAFRLTKRIPMGAGLGGGSSNATAALVGLNRLAGQPLTPARLSEVAAGVGSDCPLFLAGRPVVMRGRGERIEPLAASAAARLAGREVVVFKPSFGIATAWAYGQLAAQRAYLAPAAAERHLTRWIADPAAAAEALLLNTMEAPAFAKFPALPLMLERLTAEFGLAGRMSGSGSACFVLLRPGVSADAVTARIREGWGPGAWIAATRIEGGDSAKAC